MSQLFASDGQGYGASALASVLPVNIQGWFPLGLIALISLLFMGLSGVSSSTTVWKHQLFGTQPSLWPNSHTRTWPLEKPQLWLYRPLSESGCPRFMFVEWMQTHGAWNKPGTQEILYKCWLMMWFFLEVPVLLVSFMISIPSTGLAHGEKMLVGGE